MRRKHPEQMDYPYDKDIDGPIPDIDIGGTKYDQGKLRLDLIPPEVHRSLGETLTFGASKYGDRNWEKGLEAGRVLAAAKRHILSWEEGELIDPESGLGHLKHALTNLAFLVTLEARNKLKEV